MSCVPGMAAATAEPIVDAIVERPPVTVPVTLVLPVIALEDVDGGVAIIEFLK